MTWQPTGVALLALAALAVLPHDVESGGRADRPGTTWTTYRDERRGVSATLPPGWQRARRNLTPQLTEPREILSLATYRPRYVRLSRCRIPGCPLPTLDGFGRADALISIQERRELTVRPRDAGFAPRRHPLPLEPLRLSYPPGPRWRCARRKLGTASWTPFADGGRAFYAFVAIGPAASPATRRHVRRVLERLHFDVRPPHPFGTTTG